MTRTRLLFSEALRSIGANKSTTLAAAVTVLVGMFLLGVFIGLGTWLVSWSDAKKKELAVHTFIKDEATAKEKRSRVRVTRTRTRRGARHARACLPRARSRACASCPPSRGRA